MVKKIALIGASENPAKFGNIIFKDLRKKGFEVYPVNPNYEQLEGVKCYSSVQDLPEDTELLVFVLPPRQARSVVVEALERNFRNFWFQPGSADELIGSLLEQHPGVSLVMNRCIMLETAQIK